MSCCAKFTLVAGAFLTWLVTAFGGLAVISGLIVVL